MVFTLEHDQFILEAYFRTGFKDDDNEWSYSVPGCREQFLQKFLDFEHVTYEVFCCHIRRIVERFRRTGSVCKGKSSGRKSILTKEVLEDVQDILATNPNTSVRSMAKLTGMSFGTCHRAIKESQKKPYMRKPKNNDLKNNITKINVPKNIVPENNVPKINCIPSPATTIQPVRTQDLPNKIQGRRIVDLQYFFEKLQSIGSHKHLPGCSIATLVILRELSNGLSSELQIYCNSCKSKFTCPLLDPGSELAEINKSAVAGSVDAGIDYVGMTELFDNIGVPSMAEEKFKVLLTEEKFEELVTEEEFEEQVSIEEECKSETEDCNSTDKSLQMPVEVFIKEECDFDYCDIDIKDELVL